jgi:hypothetical protein
MKKPPFNIPVLSIVTLLLAAPAANATQYILTNPLGSNCQNVMCILGIFMNFLYVIGPAIAVIMILWGAFQIFTAGGDVEKVKAGRSTILYAVIGLVIILAGSGIDLIIQNLLSTTP